MGRRVFLGALTAGTVVSVLGGAHYVLASEEDERRARETRRPDGRPRLPPGQYLLRQLKPMGGTEGDPSPGAFRLRVHGDVEAPFTIDFAELLRMPQIDQTCDVHCVTKWSALDVRWTGVRVADLVARAKPKASARYLVFEAAAGYTANLPLRDALQPNLVQTEEGGPAIVHCGPFGNIAHGCNSIIATKLLLRRADVVFTEAGFGFDLGAEKFLDIKCRVAGIWPHAVVLVATLRALKVHGGIPASQSAKPDADAVKRGLENLRKQARRLAKRESSLTLQQAQDFGLLLYELDGQPLPDGKGGPYRLVTPGLGDLCANVKAVGRIEVRAGSGKDTRPDVRPPECAVDGKS